MDAAWELFRRGQLDQERHQRMLREAVRRNLHDLITSGEIVGGGKVRIPVKAIRQYKFEFAEDEEEGTGSFPQDGQPGGQGQGRPKKGDVVGYRPEKGDGSQGPGSDGHDEGTYEVEIGVEQVAEAIFADLELPRLQRKLQAPTTVEEYKPESMRKRGPISALLKKETIIQNIRRNAAKGEPEFKDLLEDDLRFRAYDTKRIPQDRVAVVFVRDRSGSMGEAEKALTRSLAFWIVTFLEHRYKKVADKAFVLFDTKAEEVDEEHFFHRSEGGGTAVSTGMELARSIIHERYPTEAYNLYAFVFSDGDNLAMDNPKTIDIVRDLLPSMNLIGYADIRPGTGYYSGDSQLAKELQTVQHLHLVTVNISDGASIQAAMRRFFGKGGGAA